MRMLRIVLALAVLCGAGSATPAQVALSEEVARDIRGIRLALESLLEVREAEQEFRRVDALFQRIALEERRLEPLRLRLESAQREHEDLKNSLVSLEAMHEQHEQILQEEIREGLDQPRSETRRMLDDIERTRKQHTERIDALRGRIVELENDLARSRREIEILDERLAEMLGEE